MTPVSTGGPHSTVESSVGLFVVAVLIAQRGQQCGSGHDADELFFVVGDRNR